MKHVSQNESQIRSLVERLPKDMSLSSSVWPILRDAPSEEQGPLLELYETLFRAGPYTPQKPNPRDLDQSLFTPLLADSFIHLRFHLNCSPDTFYRDACQWLVRQDSFGEQVQLLHCIVTDPRLPYFQFDPKLRRGMSDQHFSLLDEEINENTKTEIRRLVYRDIPFRHWRYQQLLAILDNESDPDQRAALLARIADEHIRCADFEKHNHRLMELQEILSSRTPDFTEEIPLEAPGELPKK